MGDNRRMSTSAAPAPLPVSGVVIARNEGDRIGQYVLDANDSVAMMARLSGGALATVVATRYATGQVLVALHEARVPTSSAAYQRGVRFLLETQLADGSWLVRTRSHFTQSHFESGFPHGPHQFISAAATHWATQALALTLPTR